MLIENISAIPQEADTVEKLYLWCFYKLSGLTERLTIEGEEEFLIDSEFFRPDGMDLRLFFITKINLPIDEDWLTNGLKLWENIEEILEGLVQSSILQDPLINDVVLWLKGDDFTDSSIQQHSPIPTNLTISNSIFKYGSGSFNFTPTNAYLSILNNASFGLASSYTLEFWYLGSSTGGTMGFAQLNGFSTSNITRFIINSVNNIYHQNRFATGVSPFNQWRHLAYVVNNTLLTIYENGENIGGGTIATVTLNANPLIVGNYYAGNNSARGHIDSFRITKGIRYTANFDPEKDTFLAY